MEQLNAGYDVIYRGLHGRETQDFGVVMDNMAEAFL
jgi:hypothetical protein